MACVFFWRQQFFLGDKKILCLLGMVARMLRWSAFCYCCALSTAEGISSWCVSILDSIRGGSTISGQDSVDWLPVDGQHLFSVVVSDNLDTGPPIFYTEGWVPDLQPTEAAHALRHPGTGFPSQHCCTTLCGRGLPSVAGSYSRTPSAVFFPLQHAFLHFARSPHQIFFSSRALLFFFRLRTCPAYCA